MFRDQPAPFIIVLKPEIGITENSKIRDALDNGKMLFANITNKGLLFLREVPLTLWAAQRDVL